MKINITTSKIDAAKLALVRRSWRLSSLLNLEITACFNGTPFKIPLGLHNGTHFADQQYLSERGSDIFSLLSQILPQRSGAVLDIGANIGMFMYLLDAIDRTRRYVAFEPNLLACAYLQRLISANKLEHHSVVPFALSNYRGIAELMLNGATDVSATIASGVYGDNWFSNSLQVPVTTGDEIVPTLLPDNTPIALVKIDVEGAELEVLQGLSKVVDQYRPVIIFELWPLDAAHGLENSIGSELEKILTERRRRAREIEQYFDTKQYSFFRMHQTGTLSATDTLAEEHQSDRHDLNFLAVPQEEARSYQALVR